MRALDHRFQNPESLAARVGRRTSRARSGAPAAARQRFDSDWPSVWLEMGCRDASHSALDPKARQPFDQCSLAARHAAETGLIT